MPNSHLNAQSVTEDDVNAVIISETFTTLPSGKVIVCELMLANGFSVRGEAAVVCLESANEAQGQEIARHKAREKVRELEGYLLQNQRARASAAAVSLNPVYREQIADLFLRSPTGEDLIVTSEIEQAGEYQQFWTRNPARPEEQYLITFQVQSTTPAAEPA